MRSGFLITLEGGEGVGKSTQVRRLVERLCGAGWPAVGTREPGGSPKAEAIRALLLSGAAAALGPAAEAVLFSAARIDHVDTLIAPSLKRGISVVSDRYTDSTRVYQGAVGKVDLGLLSRLERIAVGVVRPDLTIILDMPATIGLARAAARRSPLAVADRFEREDRGFHDSLRDAFLAVAKNEPDRCVVVNGVDDVEAVAIAIWSAVEDRLGLRPSATALRVKP